MTKLIQKLIIVILTCFLIACSDEEIHASSAALEKYDYYEEVAAQQRKLADNGSAKAQYELARMYEFGYGVELSYDTAADWYRKAAKQGSAQGQYALSSLYISALGTQPEKMIKWLRKSANQGYAVAQAELGMLYELGYYDYIKYDLNEAASWYRKAAEQGNALGQYYLAGLMSSYPYEGIDYPEAIKWYQKSGAQGYGRAQIELGILYSYGTGVEQDSTEARRLFKLAAEDSDPDTHFMLFDLYYDVSIADVAAPDPVNAYYHLRIAQESDDRRAASRATFMIETPSAFEPSKQQWLEVEALVTEWKSRKHD